ncbi:hypothetical protein EDB85DRAFT_2218933 [Lactarius pseudohatsudake]|nr:hypothetical protein EDB85DRAFT_2218933 [Lactarius pseudohatsudake]
MDPSHLSPPALLHANSYRIGCASVGRPPLRLHLPPLLSSPLLSSPLLSSPLLSSPLLSSPLLSSPLLSSPPAPLPSPTPLASKSGRSAPARSRAERELTGAAPCPRRPIRAKRGHTRVRGARALPHVRAGPPLPPRSLPSPQHPPSARKEDTSAPSPLSAPPRSHRKGAHEGTSPRPLPEDSAPTPVPFGAGDACPAPRAPPRPHTREEGWCAHPSARATPAQPHVPRPARVRKRTDSASSPAPPTDARRGTVRPPRHAGHASPAARTRKGEGQRIHPLRTGYASPAFTHAATPALARGCKRVGAPSPAPSVRGVLPSPPGLHTAPEKRHIGARVRKGESDGEGVVNEAKRSRGEAARANGGHPPHQ